MKTFITSVRLLAGIIIFTSLCAAASDIEIGNEFETRKIKHHDQIPGWTGFDAPGYAYLILEAIPAATEREQMELDNSLAFTGFLRRGDGVVIYKVYCGSGIAVSGNALAANEASFYNLEPIGKKDKTSKKIADPSKFSNYERDTLDGGVFVLIIFHDNISEQEIDGILSSFAEALIRQERHSRIIKTDPALLDALSDLEEVESVCEFDIRPPRLLNAQSRLQSRVDQAQNFNIPAMPYPPSDNTVWTGPWTGEGVNIGIYDVGIDSSVLDFRRWNHTRPYNEADPLPVKISQSYLRTAAAAWQTPNPSTATETDSAHGTHVASIAAGNGWMSTSTGAAPYTYRGVAPNASLISGPLSSAGDEGDVNNHSHTVSPSSYYSSTDANVDRHIADHTGATFGRIANILVFSAGNNGQAPYDGPQRGFYSMMADAKNAITVGSVNNKTPWQDGMARRSAFSSMGPTRDGRIKPDVVAPGSGAPVSMADINRQSDLLIELDAIGILSGAGVGKVNWLFNGTTSGFVPEGASFNYTSLVTRPFQLDVIVSPRPGFPDEARHGTQLGVFYGAGLLVDPDDQLKIQYRISSGSAETMLMRFYWWNSQSAPDPSGSAEVLLACDSSMHNLVLPVRHLQRSNWPQSASRLYRFRFEFTNYSSVTSAFFGQTAGAPPYAMYQGTSMAAPHVTGITALMLQKYYVTCLAPRGLNLRDHAFWNSTAKGILIHTAGDLEYSNNFSWQFNQPYTDPGLGTAFLNPDLHTGGDDREPPAFEGPDYATGWGLVNAEDALLFTDEDVFIQESADQGDVQVYTADAGFGGNFRATLAWDDISVSSGHYVSTARQPKLINDLDLRVVTPGGMVSLPWVLTPPPQGGTSTTLPPDGMDPITLSDLHPASRGDDGINNVEVVDFNSTYPAHRIVVRGDLVPMGPQDYSLVSDGVLTRLNSGPYRIRFLYAGADKANADKLGWLSTQGGVQLSSGPAAGLVFKAGASHAMSMAASDGKFHAASFIGPEEVSGAWLNNPSNLVGGLVIRNAQGEAVMHTAPDGRIRLRGHLDHSTAVFGYLQ